MQYSDMDDGMLTIALQTWEHLAESELKRISKHEDIKDADKESLNAFGWYISNCQAIMDEFARRKESLKFSVEEIFLAVGQTDRSGIFSFYPDSEAYKQYGEYAQGNIFYKKPDRDALEKIVQTNPLPRTDGIVFLRSHKIGESQENTASLLNQGFVAKDVMELKTFAHEDAKHNYIEKGIKEIPNTININFNLDNIDLVTFHIRLIEDIIRMGRPLLKHSLVKYYAYWQIMKPDAITPEIASEYLIDPQTGQFSDEVNYLILDGKLSRNELNDDEMQVFTRLQVARSKARLENVQKALSVPKKLLTKIYQRNKALIMEMLLVINTFETETLSGPESEYPVYWDFDRFSHIMFRHYKGLRIDESPSFSNPDKLPSLFQYVFKDIRRLIKIVVRNLAKEIDARLSEGKPFTTSGYYYNGNYYSLRVDPDGRLMQFHPL